MEKVKRRIRTCLLCVVLLAVFVGIVYYYYNIKGGTPVTEGTLITCAQTGLERLIRYGGR